MSDSSPLVVPLSGTLLLGSPLGEEAVRLVKERPSHLITLLGWTLRGRGELGSALEEKVVQRADPLPYRRDLLDHLRSEKAAGRTLVLYGSPALVERVRRETGLFDLAVPAGGSAGRELHERFGRRGFDVLGVAAARATVGAGCGTFTLWQPGSEESLWRVWTRALRVTHWIKNALVFVPVLAAQQFDRPGVVLDALTAFFAFSFVASAVYLVNDALDVHEDRQHSTKRMRPLASGAIPFGSAALACGLLLALGLAAALLLPAGFQAWLVGYLLLTSAYSLKLKGAVLIDVFTLAALYTIRVIAGAAATAISPSVWLLGFSLFFFMSLALVKRYAELHGRQREPGVDPGRGLPGRSYRPRDLPVLIALGVGTGCMAVLVLALYVISDEFAAHYTHPVLLLQLCPLVLYWIGRAWIVVARDEMHDDPVVWALKDDLSRWSVIVGIALLVLAR